VGLNNTLRIVGCVAAAVTLVANASCSFNVSEGNLEADKSATESAIDQFHVRYNAGQLELIYQEADDAPKSAASSSDSMGFLTKTRGKYGDMVSVTRHWVNAFIGAPVHVHAVYHTRFTNTDATELFDWAIDGNGKPRLVLYHVWEGTTMPGNAS
jgi:hypothetical protein